MKNKGKAIFEKSWNQNRGYNISRAKIYSVRIVLLTKIINASHIEANKQKRGRERKNWKIKFCFSVPPVVNDERYNSTQISFLRRISISQTFVH